MCDFGDDRPEVWRSATHKARKAHQCGECRRTIAIGERYTRDFAVFEGDASTSFTCVHCCVARDWLLDNCGGFSSGLEGLMHEHAVEYPPLADGLIVVADGIRAGWLGPDGVLVAVPPIPGSIADTVREAA